MLCLLPVLFTFLSSSAQAHSPDEAHPHDGIIAPIKNPPKAVQLNSNDMETLKKGQPVLKQTKDASQASGVAVQYVSATADNVWSTILNYNRYDDWVSNVDSCRVYKKEQNTLYVETLSSLGFMKFGVYTKNTVHRDKGYMTWTLDYDKNSDLNDSVGYWRVEQISVTPPVTVVEYHSKVKVGNMPVIVEKFLRNEALLKGTSWVKKQAEKLRK